MNEQERNQAINEASKLMGEVVQQILSRVHASNVGPSPEHVERSNFMSLEYEIPLDLAAAIESIGCVFGSMSAESAIARHLDGRPESPKERAAPFILAYTVTKSCAAIAKIEPERIIRPLGAALTHHARETTKQLGQEMGEEIAQHLRARRSP